MHERASDQLANDAADRLLLARLPHGPEAAFADLFDQDVRADATAGMLLSDAALSEERSERDRGFALSHQGPGPL